MLGSLLSMRVRELSDFIRNILNCVLKMNECLTGLERHEGECWGKILLKVMHYNIVLLPKKVTNYVT